ncbi:MAG: FlgD immunoglobulin-like domain containing protein [bacterium]|jgi:hypothetical protein|nr:T9SS type A sorting domain-containing protein [candidate division KSB1 bacterium]MDH7559751.1 FlgD immunoglobulin-like domain containing protein [bacterium]
MRRACLSCALTALVVWVLAAPEAAQAQSGDTLFVSNGWALPGGLDTLSIRVKNATVIKGMHFKLVDSPDKLTVVGMEKKSRLASFRVDTTSRAGGFWVLMVPDTSTSSRLTAGSDDILWVYVRVAANATGGTNASVGFDSVRAAANATGNPPLTLVQKSGVFWFGRKGDVIYNEAVDLFDVLRMIDMALQRPPTPTAYERWAGDFDNNGAVDVSDIGKAIDVAVSGLPKAAALGEEAPGAFRGAIALSRGPELNAQQFQVTIDVESPVPLAGMELDLQLAAKDLTGGTPSVCGIANGMSLASKMAGDRLHLLLYSPAGIVMPAGRGTVASLLVTSRDEGGTIPLQVLHAVGATVSGQRVDLVWEQQSPRQGQVPAAFALHQSHPNPFGATTVIAYDIPAQSSGAVDVQVAVYNIHGQLVRVLERSRREPGRYVVQWDGRDETGNSVSSGVYFYKLMAGSLTLVRKLAVLR